MGYVDEDSLGAALDRLKGTANHLIKIWFTLKQMGMGEGVEVRVTTSSPDNALSRLFSFGDPEDRLYVPFAHTPRFLTMKGDASRSIIQTTLRRWQASGSVVTVDPTSYLDISEAPGGELVVKPGRTYPRGLGHGDDGFAMEKDSRVVIPAVSFAVWYYRQDEFPSGPDIEAAVRESLASDLNLSPAEMELVFVEEDPPWKPTLDEDPLTNTAIQRAVESSLSGGATPSERVIVETFDQHVSKVRSMVTVTEGPTWLNRDPYQTLSELLASESRAILLYGPPRTGKTRAIEQLIPRDEQLRETIQIHEGWGYDELILGLRPNPEGDWAFQPGPLLGAIRSGKRFIVLEEINRTDFSRAIGEILSLIELRYRGEDFSITLKDESEFFIPRDTCVICTMNTLDRTTEEIDDALLGRMDAVEFKPRVEALHGMLVSQGHDEEKRDHVAQLFTTILQYYPLGHGYFAEFEQESDTITYYMTRIRPVLQKHLSGYRDHELKAIDETVERLFS